MARVALARAPRRFLVVRAARERCGARLGVPAARRGSFGLGVAVRGARRGRCTLRRAVGWFALAPAACALLCWVAGRSRQVGGGQARLRQGLMRPGMPLRAVRRGCQPPLASELPYLARRAPRRFLVVRAARERCGARLGAPAARRGSFGLCAASDRVRRAGAHSGERLVCVHGLWRRTRCCAGLFVLRRALTSVPAFAC